MSKRITDLRNLYSKAFDLGLECDASQMRTTLQMRSMLVKQHLKNLSEIDEWLKNQEQSLSRRIQEVERGVNDHRD